MVLAVFLVYCAFLVLAALPRLGAHRPSEVDYILAGRRLTMPALVVTLVTTWYGGILGVGEYTFRNGVSNWLVFGVPYYLYAAIFAIFLAGRARRSEALTIPDRLHARYGLGASLVGASVLFVMTAPAPYVLMLGAIGHIYAGWPVWLGILLGTALATANVYRGGLRNLVLVDAVQFGLMFLAFAVLVGVCFLGHGGAGFLEERLPSSHLAWDGGLGVQAVAVWYFIAMSTLVEPSFYQRCYAARSEGTARGAIAISILCWVLFDFLTTLSGLYARAILPDLADPVAAFPALARAVLSPFWQGVFLVGLLSVVMSTVNGYTFLAAITAGRDLWGRWRASRQVPSPAPETGPEGSPLAPIRVSLALSAIVAIAVALSSDSVVTLWHHLGSVGTPVLLVPLLLAHGRFRVSGRLALASMLLSGALSLTWLVLGGATPFLGIEAIFPGLGLSLTIMGLGAFHGRGKVPAS